MSYLVTKPPITRRQKRLAMGLAMAADAVQIGLLPLLGPGVLSPLDDILDVVAVALLLAICGFKWQFLLGFVLEVIPGLDLFPTWTLLVASLPVEGARPVTVQTVSRTPPVVHPMPPQSDVVDADVRAPRKD